MSRPLWTGLPVSLACLSAELQKAFAPKLSVYASSLRDRGIPRGFKVINDPIWFSIRVESWELVILDSPVIQRLRNIHQLGLAGLVYPAAGYSRFEHTIGTLYQTQRVVESINRNARAHIVRTHLQSEEPVSRSDEIVLRLAAILHDVGHCFLSHVSERALGRLRITEEADMDSARTDAQKFFHCPSKPAVGEVISSLIILLPEFLHVLELAKIPSWEHREPELAETLAKLVLRGRFADRPFMNEIISGALDADKLDYMPRDCYMAGLPMPIDVERILEKVCVVDLPADHKELAEYATSSGVSANQNIQVLAVQQGGAKVFEDLVVSRVLLYDKLYNHQKIRAMEGAVVSALELLRECHPSFSEFSTYLELSDAQFLERRWPSAPKSAKSSEVDIAAKIVDDVQGRDFVRAIAFGPERITDFDKLDEAGQQRLGKSWRALSRLISRDAYREAPKESADFHHRVTETARLYLTTIGQPALAAELHRAHVVIDLPDVQGIAKKTKFFVGDESSGVRLFNELFRVEKWAEAYENQKITGYVFCPSNFAVAVHVAFRDVVRKDFGLQFEPWSWSLTKIDLEEREEFTKRLRDRGIDTELAPMPQEFRDRQQYLKSRNAKFSVLTKYSDVIEQLGDRFKGYQSFNGDEITNHRIRDWLLQFDPGEIPLAITVLQHVRYWDRPAITDAFSIALDDWSDESLNAQWVPLGGATTSSIHLNYLWPDLRKKGLCPKHILASALEIHDAKTIVFYDDNVGSAGQSKTVLQQWLGIEQQFWAVNERHVSPLSPEVLENIRQARIRFLFATGRRKGLDKLISTAKELFSNKHVDGHIIDPEEVSCFRAASGIFGDKDSLEMARDAFAKAGNKALADRREEWGDEKTDDRLLGYGNQGGLNVFYYNVPTATITALWKSCSSPISSWFALFPRRPRD